MGKKSTPKAPTPPDPVATANAQAAANKDAAITQAGLNRVSQVTPQGSITWSQNGVDANGIPQYTQTQTYSPEQQVLYDQQNELARSLGGLASDNVARVATAQATPFSYDGMTPLQTNIPQGQLQYGGPSREARSDIGFAGDVQRSYDNGGAIQSTFGTGGPLTYNVGDEFNSAARSAADAMYNQAASRLDPRYQQQESDIRARLANSGISEDSDAYRRELDNFNRSKTDAYNQATYESIAAGLSAQNQGFQQGQQNAQLNNQAQGQQFTQNLGAAQFGNQAQAQRNTQNANAAAFGNLAQDQQFQQNLAGTGFFNEAQSQNFNQDQQSTATNNTAVGQQFNQNLAAAQFNNTGRQQQITEASYLRNLPLNDIAALLGTGGGVQNPTFQDFAQVGVAAPDYQGAVYANFNAANDQYKTAQANRSAGLGGLFGLAGSLGAAAIGSDRRIKYDIKRIGTLANGLNTYVFKYIGEKTDQFGVMAQEVLKIIPDAVVQFTNGVLGVDYKKVYNG